VRKASGKKGKKDRITKGIRRPTGMKHKVNISIYRNSSTEEQGQKTHVMEKIHLDEGIKLKSK
jgi:hypothetical protein